MDPDPNICTVQYILMFIATHSKVTIEYAARLRALARLLRDEPGFRPRLLCFTGGVSGDNAVADAAAGWVYFRHLCGRQGISLEGMRVWVEDGRGGDERTSLEGVAAELWRGDYIRPWLQECPLTERQQKHCECRCC